MPLTWSQELTLALQMVLAELVPEPSQRKPLTWSTVPAAFGYIVPFLFMAYLSRRRDTQIIRILLLPTIIFSAIRGTYAYAWADPKLAFLMWIRGLYGVVVTVMSIDLAISSKGRLKVGEKTLPALYDDSRPSDDSSSDSRPAEKNPLLPNPSYEAFQVTTALRGLGWEFGKGVFVPPDPRPKERSAFLKVTAKTFVRTYILTDFLITCIQCLPGIGSTQGGSIFYTNFPLFQRYLISSAIVLVSGAAIVIGFEALYALATLIGVGLLGEAPSDYPPLKYNPFAADSISDFWAKRWHQALRRTFLVMGGIPLGKLFGRVGVVLGAFFASGVFHELGAYTLGRGFDHRVTAFFTLQGVGVLLEALFKKVTGRRVGGWAGRVWVYLDMILLGQQCLDAWFMRGLGGATFIPTFLSPTKGLLLPALRRLFAS